MIALLVVAVVVVLVGLVVLMKPGNGHLPPGRNPPPSFPRPAPPPNPPSPNQVHIMGAVIDAVAADLAHPSGKVAKAARRFKPKAYRYRSAITGRYVKASYAKRYPHRTVREAAPDGQHAIRPGN